MPTGTRLEPRLNTKSGNTQSNLLKFTNASSATIPCQAQRLSEKILDRPSWETHCQLPADLTEYLNKVRRFLSHSPLIPFATL